MKKGKRFIAGWTMNKWISVKERLPEESGWYLCSIYEDREVAYYNYDPRDEFCYWANNQKDGIGDCLDDPVKWAPINWPEEPEHEIIGHAYLRCDFEKGEMFFEEK